MGEVGIRVRRASEDKYEVSVYLSGYFLFLREVDIVQGVPDMEVEDEVLGTASIVYFFTTSEGKTAVQIFWSVKELVGE
ncbi:MAG: hypothetical protein QW230_00850 [Thermofilum sp.]